MKPFTQSVFTHCSRIITKPSLTRWRISNVMSSHLYAQVLKVEKWQEMIWMPLLHPSEQSVVEGKGRISRILPLRGRAWPDFHMKIEFPPQSILSFFPFSADLSIFAFEAGIGAQEEESGIGESLWFGELPASGQVLIRTFQTILLFCLHLLVSIVT